MKKNFKVARITLLGLLVLLLIIVSPFVITTIVNNYYLTRFANQFYDLSAFDNHEVVEKFKTCGKLNGNGNGMDFFAAYVVYSDSEIDNSNILEDINNARSDDEHTSEPVLAVYKLESYEFRSDYLRSPLVFKGLASRSDYDGLYLVIMYDGGYNANFDIRGH